jgi:hypothetical protein
MLIEKDALPQGSLRSQSRIRSEFADQMAASLGVDDDPPEVGTPSYRMSPLSVDLDGCAGVASA